MNDNAQDAKHHPHLVEITVNKQPVSIDGPKATGLSIKLAAIDQGVRIETDFQLAEIKDDTVRKIIGDSDPVTVHKGSAFVATAPDDNSQQCA